jgi:predicted DNA-binding transcriptional regulator YafY
VRAVLTDAIKADLERLPYRVPVLERYTEDRARHAKVRQAATALEKLEITYRDEAGNQSRRTIWPLALMSWGAVWTILAWCETRRAYRNFRLDRIETLTETGVRFETSETISIAHYYRTEIGIEDRP